MNGRAKTISLSKIRLDGQTQSRDELNQDVVKEYSDLIAAGVEFPPLSVMYDGSHYWLYDGFHRRFAAVKADRESVKCIVTDGTLDDARWASYAANKTSGLHRSTEDKQKAVIAALKHPNGAGKSDTAIAEHVGVAVNTVCKYRKQLVATMQIAESKERTGSDGRTINTASIGKAKQSATSKIPKSKTSTDFGVRSGQAVNTCDDSPDDDLDEAKPLPPKESSILNDAICGLRAAANRAIEKMNDDQRRLLAIWFHQAGDDIQDNGTIA